MALKILLTVLVGLASFGLEANAAPKGKTSKAFMKELKTSGPGNVCSELVTSGCLKIKKSVCETRAKGIFTLGTEQTTNSQPTPIIDKGFSTESRISSTIPATLTPSNERLWKARIQFDWLRMLVSSSIPDLDKGESCNKQMGDYLEKLKSDASISHPAAIADFDRACALLKKQQTSKAFSNLVKQKQWEKFRKAAFEISESPDGRFTFQVVEKLSNPSYKFFTDTAKDFGSSTWHCAPLKALFK